MRRKLNWEESRESLYYRGETGKYSNLEPLRYTKKKQGCSYFLSKKQIFFIKFTETIFTQLNVSHVEAKQSFIFLSYTLSKKFNLSLISLFFHPYFCLFPRHNYPRPLKPTFMVTVQGKFSFYPLFNISQAAS